MTRDAIYSLFNINSSDESQWQYLPWTIQRLSGVTLSLSLYAWTGVVFDWCSRTSKLYSLPFFCPCHGI